jgi:hypothetical protein
VKGCSVVSEREERNMAVMRLAHSAIFIGTG